MPGPGRMIEAACPADADAVIGLWAVCGLTRPWNPPRADFERALDGCTSEVLLARSDDGALLGSVMVGHDGHRGWMYYLAVTPEQRGRGLGRELVTAAEHWLQERGAPKAMLMVRAGNEAAHRFYDAIGYGTSEVVVRERRLADGS